MKIAAYIDEFIRTETRYKPYSAEVILLGGKNYSLNSMPQYEESDYLPVNIKSSVMACTRGKDMAIAAYRDFVAFLQRKGIDIDLKFPPIPVESSFERLMFIAKYLQDESASIDDLSDLLWVDRRTIENDLARLRGNQDPIQICGRPFIINETTRSRGKLHCASTAHPFFLTENLTQVIAILKGLRFMAGDPMYKEYAEATAAEIWGQLSTYAQKRIHYVLTELFSEDVGWFEALKTTDSSFVTESECSNGCSVLLDCMKNGKTFFLECQGENGVPTVYKDCRLVPGSYDGDSVEIECTKGKIKLQLDHVVRSSYSLEGLIAD